MTKPALTTLACLLCLTATAGASAQAVLTQTTTRAGQMLMGPGGRGVGDNSSKDGAETVVQTAEVLLDRFDKARGVLVGVSGALRIDSATTLSVSRPTSSGEYDGTGTVRATWSLPGSSVFSGSTGLAQVVTVRDAPAGSVDTWRPLAFTGAASLASGFVGDAGAPLATSVVTTLVASKAKQNGDGSVIARISDSLTAEVGLSYRYLRHARASFAGAGASDQLALALHGTGAAFGITALGDEHTTGLDLLGLACSGDCDRFALALAVDDLAAGGLSTGTVARLGPARGGAATYLLTLGDDTAVGAAASHATHTLSLAVSAVPEPQSWALMLAGLGAVLRLARRRC